MVVVNNVGDFAYKNEKDVLNLLRYKGITDKNVAKDILQNFYIRLLKSDALSTYNPEIAGFERYITTILYNMLPYENKRNPTRRYKHITCVYNQDSEGRESTDVFDLVYGCTDDNNYGISKKNAPSSLYISEEEEITKHICSFIQHIKDTEPDKVKAQKMICYIESKMHGCVANDIALMLGVSDNMIKIMKNSLYERYKKWETARGPHPCLA